MANSNHLDYEKVYRLSETSHTYAATLRKSLEIIEDSLKEYGVNSVALSFNGGKDCTVLLHLFASVRHRLTNPKNFHKEERVPTLYIHTKDPFDEIEKFVKESEDTYLLELHRADGTLKSGLERFLEKHKEIKAILIGTRRTDPFADRLGYFEWTSEGWPKVMRVHPILDWDYQMVWWLIRELNIPYCELYDHGYTSLGDVHNTLPNPALKRGDSYAPAWKLKDGTLEREGRIKKENKLNGC